MITTASNAPSMQWAARWRRVSATVRKGSPLEAGREVDTLRRLETVAGVGRPIALVSSDASLEPGVFGLVHQVLLWPRSVGKHLEDRQVEAILAHELPHVRRHDNLAAASHMVVEVLFSFHPLVWWLGTRLVDERERACDEESSGGVASHRSTPRAFSRSVSSTRRCRWPVWRV